MSDLDDSMRRHPSGKARTMPRSEWAVTREAILEVALPADLPPNVDTVRVVLVSPGGDRRTLGFSAQVYLEGRPPRRTEPFIVGEGVVEEGESIALVITDDGAARPPRRPRPA